jgi:hypothetical protein
MRCGVCSLKESVMFDITRLAILAVLSVCASPAAAAVYDIADGDVASLITAINKANATAADDVVNLALKGDYVISAPYPADPTRPPEEPTGLPIIRSPRGGVLTINGNGAAIRRNSALSTPRFRLLLIQAGAVVRLNQLKILGGAAFEGGGVLNRGVLEAVDTVISNNVAYALGGGLFNSGRATLTQVTFMKNRAEPLEMGYGGGVWNEGTMQMTRVLVQGNRARTGGGISSTPDAVLVIADSMLAGNIALTYGGGLESFGDVSVTRSTFRKNEAESGGGIAMLQGELQLRDSTVKVNWAAGFGGGIFSFEDVRIWTSTINGNYATRGGGGIYHRALRAGVWRPPSLFLTNSTISGNRTKSADGGGILVDPRSPDKHVYLANSTITLNVAEAGGSAGVGGLLVRDVEITLQNTIVSGNIGRNYHGPLPVEFSNFIDGSARLGPLADNGGPTLTHAPRVRSPVINAGFSAHAVDLGDPGYDGHPLRRPPPLTFDQRGLPRFRLLVDIGAVEDQR